MAVYLDCVELHPETLDYICDENMMVQVADPTCAPAGKEVEVCLKELLE